MRAPHLLALAGTLLADSRIDTQQGTSSTSGGEGDGCVGGLGGPFCPPCPPPEDEAMLNPKLEDSEGVVCSTSSSESGPDAKTILSACRQVAMSHACLSPLLFARSSFRYR